MPRIFWIIVGLSTVLALLIVIFLVLRGLQEGRQQAAAQQRQQIGILLQQAQDAQDEGNPQAALDAYRRLLILDPENEEAVAGLNDLLNGISQQAAVAPTSTPERPNPTPTSLNSVDAVWADAQALYDAGRWEETIDRLRQIQAADPDFEAARIEEMLFTSYASLATEKSNSGGLEEAVRLYERALEIRPDAVEIRTMRDVTAQYVDALTYWYADWPRVIELLGTLYQQSPNYRDVRQRLQKAHLEYGDSLARQGDWCSAAEQYAAAIEVQNGPGLESKQVEFQTLCETAPEDLVLNEDGIPVTEADATNDAEVLPLTEGLGTGRIFYASQDPVDGRYRIYAQPVTASVRPVVVVEDAMQPDLRADGQRLAFRSMRGDTRGLGSYDPGSGLRLRFTTYAEDSMPSWNPEGNRLVFASDREGDRRWRIYTVWADGNDNGASLVFGQDPSWHPSQDRIIYKGCDERGNACGLWTMNSSGGDQAPLTTVPGDSHPVWSPDGRYVIFMSAERHGNWEIYRINVETSEVIRLTDDPAIDGIPAVSPDGSRIAFLSNRGGSWQIWIKPITGGPEQPLAPITGNLPDWLETKLHWVP